MSNYFMDYYGEEHQKIKLVEECLELVIAIFNNYKGFKILFIFRILYIIWIKRKGDNISEEMGDVSNIISQFEEHQNSGEIYCWKIKKQSRQIVRVKKEKELLIFWFLMYFKRLEECELKNKLRRQRAASLMKILSNKLIPWLNN